MVYIVTVKLFCVFRLNRTYGDQERLSGMQSQPRPTKIDKYFLCVGMAEEANVQLGRRGRGVAAIMSCKLLPVPRGIKFTGNIVHVIGSVGAIVNCHVRSYLGLMDGV